MVIFLNELQNMYRSFDNLVYNSFSLYFCVSRILHRISTVLSLLKCCDFQSAFDAVKTLQYVGTKEDQIYIRTNKVYAKGVQLPKFFLYEHLHSKPSF